MVASKRGPLKGVPFWRAIVPLPGFFSFVTCQVTVDRLGIRQYYHTFTGVQLKADRVDFEAKWRHYSLNDTAVAIHPPSSAPADSICVSARA